MAAYSVLDSAPGLNTSASHSTESSCTEPISDCFTVALAKLNALMQIALSSDLVEQPEGVVYNYLLVMADQLEDVKQFAHELGLESRDYSLAASRKGDT